VLALVVIPAVYFLWNRRALGTREDIGLQNGGIMPVES